MGMSDKPKTTKPKPTLEPIVDYQPLGLVNPLKLFKRK
ncbi:MAG: hypothetical protein JWN38_1040 [Candidatus Saccharibacteria bacterium]|nr:hypothetical protein [Candidatus Saccharibacteria bacterium]